MSGGTRFRQFRFASWNLRFGRADLGLLLEHQPDLVALQEVKAETFQALRPHFAWGHFSLDLWADGPSSHCHNGHGTAILGTDTFNDRGARLLPHLVAPWKLLVVDVAFRRNLGYFTVASYHALNGRCGPDGHDKPRLTLQVADWLEHEPGPVVVGMDANSPQVDHPDHARTRCFFNYLGPGGWEDRLLGHAPRHRLRDVLRAHLEAHPEELEARRQAFRDGPLEVSHRTGRDKTRPGKPRRFDHIFATPDFEPASVRYLYDEALDHRSDHALVLADLRVTVAWGHHPDVDCLLPTALTGRAPLQESR